MSVGTADVWKWLNTAWDASGLDDLFRVLWSDPTDANFEVLNDQEASPSQPFPYCVVELPAPKTLSRMSDGVDSLREIREPTITLNVHASVVESDLRDAKEIGAYLVEEIMKQFGGHPTTTAGLPLVLDNGNVLALFYDTDYCLRTDDNEVQWVLRYRVQIDVPVMA